MTDRTRRIGENEALFREVNERLDDLNETFATLTQAFEIVCECGDETCLERIAMSPEDYTRLRSDATRFAVLRGHVARDVEYVVEEHGGYVVVQKKPGIATEIARATEPDRSR